MTETTQQTAPVQETKPGEPIWTSGKRKTAIARVKTSAGSGKVVVNRKELEKYFVIERHKNTVLKPVQLVPVSSKYDFSVNVNGGGLCAQSEAVRNGISRALAKLDPASKVKLRDEGFLTRDAREVERKKPGQPKARKKFQWTKR